MIQWINNPDIVPTVILIALLCGIGNSIVGRWKKWGYRVAIGAALAYSVYGVLEFHPRSTGELVWIILRSFLVYGLAYGLGAIVFGVLGFLHDEIVHPVLQRYRYRKERRMRDRPTKCKDVIHAPVKVETPPELKSADELVGELRKKREQMERIIRENADDKDMRDAMEEYQRQKFQRELGRILDET